MSIYSEFMRRVEDGEPFHIDFQKRNMKVGKEYLIKNGEYDTKNTLFISMGVDDVLTAVEGLYYRYKHSLPTEKSEKQRRKYFKACTIEELSDFHLFNPIRRDGAQARLEGFILCMILNGSFVWDEEKMGKWFWQSKNDPDLVILRDWIENK